MNQPPVDLSQPNNQPVFPISSIDLLKIINGFNAEAGLPNKRHDNFMRDIRDELGEEAALNFEGGYLDINGQERPCYILPKTEALIVGARTSKTIRARIVAYLESLEQKLTNAHAALVVSEENFRTLEKTVNSFAEFVHFGLAHVSSSVKTVADDVKELSEQNLLIDSRVSEQTTEIKKLKNEIIDLKKSLHKNRREFSRPNIHMFLHISKNILKRCPWCDVSAANVNKWECDHFHGNQHNQPTDGWAICKPCHDNLTTGIIPRSQARAAFEHYQNLAKKNNWFGSQEVIDFFTGKPI